MAEIIPIYLDKLPTYIPFIVQCSDGSGEATNPTVDSLIIYEEGGADATFDSTTITGSPFDPAQINSQAGLWGVMVAKSALTAGKIYIAYWELSIDGTAAAKAEVYLACNASDFKADLSTLEGRLTSARAGYLDKLNVSGTLAHSNAASTYKADVSGLATAANLATVDTVVDAIKAKTDNLPADPAGVSDLPGEPLDAAGVRSAVGLASANLDTQLGNVPTVAEFEARTIPAANYFDPATDTVTVGNPNDCKADVSGLATSAALATVDTVVDAIKAKTDNLPDDPAGVSDLPGEPLDAAGVRSAVGLASANLDTQLGDIPTVTEFNARTLPSADYFDAASDSVTVGNPNDCKADVSGLATAAALATVDSVADAIKAKTDNLPSDPAGVSDLPGDPPSASSIADAIWDEAAADHTTSGTTGAALGAAGSAGDPWETSLPGSYGAGTAGKIVGDNLDVAVSTRLAASGYSAPLDAGGIRSAVGLASANLDTQLATIDSVADGIKARTDLIPDDPAGISDLPDTPPTEAAVADAVWDELLSGHVLSGSAGAKLGDQVNPPSQVLADYKADVSGLSTFDPATDAVTVGTNNDKTGYSLSISALLAIWNTFTSEEFLEGSLGSLLVNMLDEAISSRLAEVGYTSPPSEEEIWGYVNRTLTGNVTVGNPNDCKADVSALATSAALAAVDAIVDAIKLKTDNLPADPAGVSDLPAEPLDAAGVRSAVGLASANLDTQLADIPTVAEFEARTLPAASYSTHTAGDVVVSMHAVADDFKADVSLLATASDLADVAVDVTAIGAVTVKIDDTLELDGAYYRFTANALEQAAAASAADIRAEIDSNSTQLAAIKAKTDLLPADPAGISDLPTTPPTEAAIADAVWDELIAGHSVSGSTGEALSRLDVSVSSISVGDISVNVTAEAIHDALDSWEPTTEPPTPPIITPPDDPEDCRIHAWLGGIGASADYPTDAEAAEAYIQIHRMPYSYSGRYWNTEKTAGTYDDSTGVIYWDVVRGARIRVVIPTHGVDRRLVVPDATTYNLSA